MLRRATAVLLNLLLLQVGLVGYGAGCAEQSNVTSMAATMTHGADAPPATERACREIAAGEGCSVPMPAGCAALTGCVVPAMPARINLAVADAPAAERGWGDPALARPAARPAPDLPPPRA